MTITDVAPREPDESMVQGAVLLDRAALLAWEHAEVAGVESPLHDMGLGVCLARGSAAQMLTVGRPTEQHADIDEQSVLKSPHPRQVTHRPAGRLHL